jgi:hypothetical protein
VDGVPKPNLVFSAAKPAAGLSTGPRGFVSVLSFHLFWFLFPGVGTGVGIIFGRDHLERIAV